MIEKNDSPQNESPSNVILTDFNALKRKEFEQSLLKLIQADN